MEASSKIRPIVVVASAAAVLVTVLLLRRRRRQPKIAFVNNEDAPKWSDAVETFSRVLNLPTSCFVRFDSYRGEFPSAAALRRGDFCGMIITGSHYSAVDPSLPWLPALFDCIRTASALPHVNVVACCFGCQAVAVALGGRVGANESKTFAFGKETISVALDAIPSALNKSASQWAPTPPSKNVKQGTVAIEMLESHGEQVLELPPGASLLATSPSAPFEMFLCGAGGNVLCCQAHPELDATMLRDRIEPALRGAGKLNQSQLAVLQDDPVRFYSSPVAGGGCGVVCGSQLGCRLYRDFLLSGPAQALQGLWRELALST